MGRNLGDARLVCHSIVTSRGIIRAYVLAFVFLRYNNFFLSGSNEWRREWFSSVFVGYQTAHSHSTVSVKLQGRSMTLVLDHDVPF